MSMVPGDYPIDLRADYPARSSRAWAALTILWIKFFALLPHFVVLFFLAIAQFVVALVAQLVVAVKGEYPPGMHKFVVGVLRWRTRVSAFFFSLTDRYPPFSLEPDDTYPVDVVVERPATSSRLYAVFTVIVEVIAVVGFVALVLYFVHLVDASGGLTTSGPDTTMPSARFNPQTYLNASTSGLVLRQIAALPHLVILGVLGFVALILWAIVQWVILFAALYPRSLFDFVAAFMRWQVRVDGYALGLVDRYPPFTMDPSITAAPAAPAAWYADPTGRHAHRYWDGWQWTPHVADDGRASLDPIA
jgi:hypothetical protein